MITEKALPPSWVKAGWQRDGKKDRKAQREQKRVMVWDRQTQFTILFYPYIDPCRVIWVQFCCFIVQWGKMTELWHPSLYLSPNSSEEITIQHCLHVYVLKFTIKSSGSQSRQFFISLMSSSLLWNTCSFSTNNSLVLSKLVYYCTNSIWHVWGFGHTIAGHFFIEKTYTHFTKYCANFSKQHHPFSKQLKVSVVKQAHAVFVQNATSEAPYVACSMYSTSKAKYMRCLTLILCKGSVLALFLSFSYASVRY